MKHSALVHASIVGQNICVYMLTTHSYTVTQVSRSTHKVMQRLGQEWDNYQHNLARLVGKWTSMAKVWSS
jgi:hypothetical protein